MMVEDMETDELLKEELPYLWSNTHSGQERGVNALLELMDRYDYFPRPVWEMEYDDQKRMCHEMSFIRNTTSVVVDALNDGHSVEWLGGGEFA